MAEGIPQMEMADEAAMVDEAAAQEEAGFDHEAHMQKVQEGLQQILASNNLQEIKQIAQALLIEEQGEQEVEEGAEEPGFREAALAAMQGGGGEA